MRCACGWRPVAATPRAAAEAIGQHIVDDHGEEVDADVPDGKVLVNHGDGDGWSAVDPDDVAHR